MRVYTPLKGVSSSSQKSSRPTLCCLCETHIQQIKKNNQIQGMGIHFHAFDSQAAHTIMRRPLRKPRNSYSSRRPAINFLSTASSVLHIQQFAQFVCAIP